MKFQVGDEILLGPGTYLSDPLISGVAGGAGSIGVVTKVEGGVITIRFDSWNRPTDGVSLGWNFNNDELSTSRILEPFDPEDEREIIASITKEMT
jgi:hypothetical protein